MRPTTDQTNVEVTTEHTRLVRVVALDGEPIPRAVRFFVLRVDRPEEDAAARNALYIYAEAIQREQPHDARRIFDYLTQVRWPSR